jgi:sialidase-1
MQIDRRQFLGGFGAVLPTMARERAPEFREVDVFRAGDDGYHTYRIPALLATKKGTLLAFAEGRKDNAKDHGDIDLVLKRSEDGGKTWSAQSIVHEEGGTAKTTIGNACPVVDVRTGNIVLPFTRDNDDVFAAISKDDGRTWSTPQQITASVKKDGWSWYATGPGVGIQLQSGRYKGRLVIPCDHREEVNGQSAKVSHVFFSDDGGRTWKLGGSAKRHTDECQVVQLSDGSLMLNMRNYWERDGGEPQKGRKRAISRSADGGETWPDLWFDETLIEPVCQASLITYAPKGKPSTRLLFSNPASRESRVQLTVRASSDNGKTWPVSRLVCEGPSAYSCLATLHDGSIGLLYERGEENAYEKIAFARFNLEWLQQEGKS